MKIVGIIAGNGRLPILIAKEAVSQGYRVVVCALQGEADESIKTVAAACQWVKLGELRKLVRFFQNEGVSEVLMAGKVEKVRLFQENVRPDFDMFKVIMKVRDFKDDSLLAGIANYLDEKGIHLLDSTMFFKDAMPGLGVLGKKKPSKKVMEEIRFGFRMAKSIAGLDIGQTVVVKRKAVLAIEAIEGTDQAIRRGAELGRGHITVVKVAKPSQDMRFDVPTVGLRTMKELIDAEAVAFAFEAGKTIFIDQEDFIDRANRKGIVLIGVDSQS